MLRSRKLLLVLGLALASACGPVHDDVDLLGVDDQSSAIDRFGLVVLSYTEDRRNLRVRDQLAGVGWFVEHEGPDRAQALALLTAPLVGERAPGTVGTCRTWERMLPALAGSGSYLYLMDAGELSIETAEAEIPLESTYFPDVYPHVSGLLYDGILHRARAILGFGQLRVVGHGSSEVGPFEVELAPPEPVRVLSVDGQHVWGSRVEAAPGADGGPLEVVWSAPTRGTGDGLSVVELVRRGFDRVAVVSCTTEDDGSFEVPAELIAGLPDYGPDQTDRLNLYRSTTQAFSADGLTGGQVVFLAKDSLFLD